jgi:hypothetical protein
MYWTPVLDPLNTTDFATTKKVDVDTALLEKVQSEEVKAR